MKSASRMSHLAPHFFASLGTRIAARTAQGFDVIRLDEGSPDLPPAANIIAALTQAAADSERHGYQPHRGPQALRSAWAQLYRSAFGVETDPEREIVPLLGSKEGIFHLLLACIEPGDIVLIPDPGYITYTRGALFAGGEPFYLPLLRESGYLPDLEAIPPRILRRAKILWLNYPNNPTAAVAPLGFFNQAVQFARANNLLVCHDAAYAQVTYNGAHTPSILQVPGAKDVAVEFNTLSKSHNMAGWRVGAALGNPDALAALFTLKTNADSSHFLPILEAAVEAMTGDQGWLVRRNEIYRARRDQVMKTLRSLDLEVDTPQASLYVWCPVPLGWSSVEFTASVLEAANVSLTPGTVFGPGGEGFVRISLTAPIERISQAMDRLTAAFPRLGKPSGK